PLLYLAGLTNFDVLLGKLSAAGIPSLLALLSVFPLLAFPLLLGGVEGVEVTRLVLILLSTLWLGLAAGVWGSIRSTYQADSVRKALLLLLGLLLGGAAFATIIVFFSNRFQTRKIWPWLFALMAMALLGADILFAISFRYLPGSPLYDLVRVSSGPLPGIWPGAFWLSMALSFCGGLLVIASAAASRVSSEPDSEHFRSTSRTKGK